MCLSWSVVVCHTAMTVCCPGVSGMLPASAAPDGESQGQAWPHLPTVHSDKSVRPTPVDVRGCA